MVRSYCSENMLSGTIGGWIGSMAKLTDLYAPRCTRAGMLRCAGTAGYSSAIQYALGAKSSNPLPPFAASTLPPARPPAYW